MSGRDFALASADVFAPSNDSSSELKRFGETVEKLKKQLPSRH